MELALELARKCCGYTFPNPPVGCIIVEYDKIKKHHKIISFGQTQKTGRPHAEFNAISKASFKSKKEYFCYSSLEPCSHLGRSHSCVDEILKHPISEVFFSIIDPDKRVFGNGSILLKKNGVKVSHGILKNEALELYKGYFLNRILGRPKVTLKIASSLDGKIAGNKDKWITNETSRKFVHRLRFDNDAVLIGGNTAKTDDPRLNCRIKGLEKFSPIKIVVKKNFDLSKNLKIFSKSKKTKTIVFTTSIKKEEDFKVQNNIEIRKLKKKEFNFKTILRKLTEYGISNVLVEGGSKINSFLLQEDLVDDLIIFRSNFFIGENGQNTLSNLDSIFNPQKKKFILKQIDNFDNDVIEMYESQNLKNFLKKVRENY